MKYELIAPVNERLNELEQILTNRGIALDKIDEFLNPTSAVILNPYDLNNIENAAKILLSHILKNHKIFVQVDSDCDGYTSSAILLNYLHRIFPSRVENNFIYRLHDSKHHGIILDTVPDDVKLVIAPDSSSNECEEHKQLSEKNIDVIVLDHHHANLEVDEPAIIVNNQLSDYQNKDLSGAGIVYKFCKVLDAMVGVDYADDYLDLAALGMTADMMDIRSAETHYYILNGFANIKNLFFTKLIQKQEFAMGGEVNPHTVGWYIAPMVNAMTRSGNEAEKLCLFKAMLDYEGCRLVPSTKRGGAGTEELLVDQAVRTCGNVKNHQEKNKKMALEMIEPMLDDNKKVMIIIKLDEPVDTNLTGLLANQILGARNMPVLILNKTNRDGSIHWDGSGRGMNTERIHDWRAFIESTGFADYAEGHANAFGVGFSDENLQKFQNYLDTELADMTIESCYPVDYIWNQFDAYDEHILRIAECKSIWGQNVAEPNVVLSNIALRKEDISLLGKGTLKLNLKNHETTVIKFGGEEIYNNLMEQFPFDESIIYITLIGTCSINEYMGIKPQLKLIDYIVERVVAYSF